MSVYHKFGINDLPQTQVHTSPKIVMASGSTGWRGSVGASSSLSLYEGVRARFDVGPGSTSGLQCYPLDIVPDHSIDKVVFITGSYPATGSVQMVKVRANEYALNGGVVDFSQVTATDWYKEHWGPIERLYDYYSFVNSNYFTGSYDYYSLYFKEPLRYKAEAVLFSGSGLATVTSSFTFASWIKPVAVTSSFQDFTILSQRARWKFYITGSTGDLAFSDYATTVTSSVAVTAGIWSHVALTVTGNSASFYVNSQLVSQAPYTGSLLPYAGNLLLTSSFLAAGAEYVLSASSLVPQPDNGFQGFIFESRVWNSARSASQISSSWKVALTGSASGSSKLVTYARFNDGPLSARHGYAQGSGVFDYSPTAIHGQFVNFRQNLPVSPEWQPNDNIVFQACKAKILPSAGFFKVLHVPSMFYGRQIATGSVVLTCNAYNNQGIVRTLNDDGRGGLYVSGSLLRPVSGRDYRGVGWNKVGNVFYSEGIVVITDPSLLDFGETNLDSSASSDQLQVSFAGQSTTNVKFFICRLDQTQGNASNNPTFSKPQLATTNKQFLVTDLGHDGGPVTYITAVGIYNENHDLVAVAKLAQPIRKREKDKLTFRLRLDI